MRCCKLGRGVDFPHSCKLAHDIALRRAVPHICMCKYLSLKISYKVLVLTMCCTHLRRQGRLGTDAAEGVQLLVVYPHERDSNIRV